MSRQLIALMAIAAAAACGRGEPRQSATADSLNRDLQLAPVDTNARLADRPADTAAPAPAPAAPAPKPAAPSHTTTTKKPTTSKPSAKPSSAAPSTETSSAAATPAPTTSRTLAAGATIVATTTREIRSNTNKVGDQIEATVAKDVTDANGRVVIPAGSTVTLAVTALHESENKSDTTGTMTLDAKSVTVNGQSYPINGQIRKVNTQLQGRKTNVNDAAKVGAGAGIGAVAGRVLGGSTKGAIIGGIIGGAVGAQRAVETKDRDVVLPSGTEVTITLQDQLVVQKS
jgi:type IV secretory pathway VirB10-like protein